MTKKEKLSRFSFVLNGFLFGLSAFTQFSEKSYLVAFIHLLAAAANLLMLVEFNSQSLKEKLNLGVFFMNVVVAVSIALQYYRSGSKYIHFVWILTAVLSSFVFVKMLNNSKR